jgi:dihydrofolate reductase
MISAIAAMDRFGIIGNGKGLPWRSLPRDMARFKQLTFGKPVIMGRGTYDSMSAPLPERFNIVMSREIKASPFSRFVPVKSVYDAISEANDYHNHHYTNEAFIIGGGQIFEQTVELWDRIYLTVVGKNSSVTMRDAVRFPITFADRFHWECSEFCRHSADDRNRHDMTFITLDRMSRERVEMRPDRSIGFQRILELSS